MKTNSCLELPKHFSRREFMHVGLVGGLGLTLADFMRIKLTEPKNTTIQLKAQRRV